MGEDFLETDEYHSMKKGLIWVMSQQTPEGGWPNSPGQGPVAEVTGHVLNVLAEMDCIDCDAARRAFRWLGDIHIKRGGTIQWGRDIMFREEDLWAATMLCATSMLRSKLTLPFKKVELIQTLQHEIKLLTSLPKSIITRRLSCWTYLASANSAKLMDASYQKEMRKILWHCMKAWRMRGRSMWDSYKGETIKETAQVALALMLLPKRHEHQKKHIKSVIQFLIDRAQASEKGQFWQEEPTGDAVGTRREPPFFSTRWCILALQEAMDRGFSVPGSFR